MNITELPVEVGALIFTYLDIKSKINACSVVQLRIFLKPCFTRKVDWISRSTLASAKTLSLDGLQDIAMYIEELNLSGIRDLTAGILSKYIQRCTNLRTLDVTFTEISLCDLDDICCETLKNISIDYFPWTHGDLFGITYDEDSIDEAIEDRKRIDEIWTKVTDVFKKQKFECVHFVVLDFDYLDLPLKFIEDVPMVKDLKITLANNYGQSYTSPAPDPLILMLNYIGINFEKLCYVICDCLIDEIAGRSDYLKGVRDLDYTKIEYIFIMYSKTLCIYVSPMIRRILCQLDCNDLSTNVCSRLPSDINLDGNIVFKAWNKDVTIFDEEFFKNLLIELCDYFPTYICMKSNESRTIVEAPNRWYCLDNCRFDGTLDILPKYVSLSDFCRSCMDIQQNQTSMSLTPAIKAFINVTFLSVNYKYGWEHHFFTVLFTECKKLNTLDVDTGKSHESSHGSALPLFNSLHMAKSLKNLRIMLISLELNMVFNSLCQCPTLENVHIGQYGHRYYFENYYEEDSRMMSRLLSELNIPLVLKKCSNLYNLFLQADLDTSALNTLSHTLRVEAQKLGRDYLHIELYDSKGSWNPFADVFSPSPLQITQ